MKVGSGVALSCGVVLAGLAYAGFGSNSPTSLVPALLSPSKFSSSDDALRACVALTRHPMDAGPEDALPFLDINTDKALEACLEAAREKPDSASALEHLGRAHFAAALQNGSEATQASETSKAREAYEAADKLGSIYATSSLALLDRSAGSADQNVLSRAIGALTSDAARGSTGAQLVLAHMQLEDESGGLKPPSVLDRQGTLTMIQSAAKGGKAGYVYRWHAALKRSGYCERSTQRRDLADDVSRERRIQEANKSAFCQFLIHIAAEAGEPRANLALAKRDLEIAQNYAASADYDAKPAMKNAIYHARKRLRFALVSSDSEVRKVASKIDAELDTTEMNQDRLASIALAGVILLISQTVNDGSATSDGGTDHAKEQRDIRCRAMAPYVATETGIGKYHMGAAWGGCYDR